MKDPNWQAVDQLGIYKVMVRAKLEPGTYGFQVEHPNCSAMLPLINVCMGKFFKMLV